MTIDAARAGLDAIFRPRTIAVVGASRDRIAIGHEILHNLIEYGFTGSIFPVNPRASTVHSLKCYPDPGSVPDPVDLAVIVVPRDVVPAAVDACGRAGVKGVVVITAGFKEVGGEGVRREAELLAMVRHYGMRMIGPNCMGVVNTHPDIRMNATFAKAMPISGEQPAKIGFISQSGALGEAILADAREMSLGISMFASTGNKADISGNDLLEYWEDDPTVALILMYIESFGNPTKFTRIARRITRRKPILLVKAGRSASGARAASTHTGSMAGLDIAVDSLLLQCGVIRSSSIQEMFVQARTLGKQPVPAGARVCVVSNAGGPAILAADACESLGLTLPPLSPASLTALKGVLPPEGTPANPIDLIASAGPDRYAPALRIALADPDIDALLVIFVSPIMIDAHAVARAIVSAVKDAGGGKPVVTCFMGKVGWQEGIRELAPAEAIAFGLEVGYPIVLKADAPQFVHKTEHKVLRLDLRNDDEAGAAFRDLRGALDGVGGPSVIPIVAQKMIRGGKEVILGAFQDPQFGPVGMFGMGGIYVEVLKDVAFRVLPITDRDAAAMISGIRGYPLLAGVRGEAPVDVASLEQMLLRLSQMMIGQTRIDSIDINPFIVSGTAEASAAVDARIRLRLAQ